MCTSLTLKTDDFYFGRNMDIEYGFGESVVITPRNYNIKFRKTMEMKNHYVEKEYIKKTVNGKANVLYQNESKSIK